MKKLEVEGIIIKDMDFKENSKILTILTKEYGIISVISKGCKSMKSKLRSVSLKLTYASFCISYKEDGLSTLIEGTHINYLKNIMFDVNKISYVTYILELTKEVLKENNNYSDIFNDMINAILKINDDLDERIITNILEVKYLKYLGILPELNCCIKCGNSNDITTISVNDGGYICKNCYTGGKIYDEKVIKLIRLFYLVDLEKVTKLDIKDNIIKDINEFIDIYYEEYTGLFLKSKIFLKKLNKVGK